MDSGIFISHHNVGGLYDNRRIGLHDVSADFCDDGSFDAVMLVGPDHWHALVATEGAWPKKEIVGEPPQVKTLGKRQAGVRAVHNIKSSGNRFMAAIVGVVLPRGGNRAHRSQRKNPTCRGRSVAEPMD
jgi:hypothetical protein